MKTLTPFIPLFVYCFAYLALFGAWVATVLCKTPGAEDIVTYIRDALIGLTAHVMTILQPTGRTPNPANVAPPLNAQAGRTQVGFLFITFVFAMGALCVAVSMTGCASVTQAAGAYEASAVTAVKNAEDLHITTWTATVCGTPFSATIRHPEIIPAIKALCLPGGQASNPANLLDAALK